MVSQKSNGFPEINWLPRNQMVSQKSIGFSVAFTLVPAKVLIMQVEVVTFLVGGLDRPRVLTSEIIAFHLVTGYCVGVRRKLQLVIDESIHVLSRSVRRGCKELGL